VVSFHAQDYFLIASLARERKKVPDRRISSARKLMMGFAIA